MREVLLGRNQRHSAYVSDEDYAWVVQWRWQYKVSRNGKVYAKRSHRIEGRRVTTLLSHAILIHRMGQPRPGPDWDADHINDNSLMDTRDNLQWEPSKINQTRPHRRESYSGRRTYKDHKTRVRRNPSPSPCESPPF